MAINFLTQRKLEDFIRSHVKGNTFAVTPFEADYGDFIKVDSRAKQHYVPIPTGDKAFDTLADVSCIIKENGFLVAS